MSRRQEQKAETMRRRIAVYMKKLEDLEDIEYRSKLAKALREFNAPPNKTRLGRPPKFTKEEREKLPLLVETIKAKEGFKTDSEALMSIINTIPNRSGLSKHRELRKLQVQLSKARR